MLISAPKTLTPIKDMKEGRNYNPNNRDSIRYTLGSLYIWNAQLITPHARDDDLDP